MGGCFRAKVHGWLFRAYDDVEVCPTIVRFYLPDLEVRHIFPRLQMLPRFHRGATDYMREGRGRAACPELHRSLEDRLVDRALVGRASMRMAAQCLRIEPADHPLRLLFVFN